MTFELKFGNWKIINYPYLIGNHDFIKLIHNSNL